MFYYHINLLSELSALINSEISLSYYNSHFHPLSIQIIRRSSIYSKFTLYLLNLTLLRFSDCLHFNLLSAVNCGSFYCVQKKTKRLIKRPFPIFNEELKSFLLYNYDKLYYPGYEMLRSELKRILLSLHFSDHFDFNSRTHLFRHLNASFMYENNFPQVEIKEALGHSDLTSTDFYIHDDLPLVAV
jgi:hypothetical protein